MGVVDLRTYRDPSHTPLLVLMDTQREYVSENRALCLDGVGAAVGNCRRMLRFARERGMPVAFLRWQQSGKFFAHLSEASGWIDGLRPSGIDMIFDRDLPSAYANDEFARMMERGGGANAVLAGFTGTLACLSTLIDAYHRHHRMTFVWDASASHPLRSLGHEQSHCAATDIARLYGNVVSVDEWFHQQQRAFAGVEG